MKVYYFIEHFVDCDGPEFEPKIQWLGSFESQEVCKLAFPHLFKDLYRIIEDEKFVFLMFLPYAVPQ